MEDDKQFDRIVLIKAGQAEKTIPLVGSELVFGRTEPADVVLSSPSVSRRQARVFREGDRIFLEDLQSSNGTRINGEQITSPVQLKDGDEILLGLDVHLRFYAADVPKTVQSMEAPVTQTYSTDIHSTMMVNLKNVISVEKENSGAKATMLDVKLDEAALAAMSEEPPRLLIQITGEESRDVLLTTKQVRLGRSDDNDIVVALPIVSRYHLIFEQSAEGYVVSMLPNAINRVSCRGKMLDEPRLLRHGDVLRMDSDVPGMLLTLTYCSPAAAKVPLQIQFGEQDVLTFGRDAGNDVCLNMPSVSRYHAEVTRVGRRYYITDLRSANGTFVNDASVDGNVWLNPQDVIRIGPYRFVMGEDAFTAFEDTDGLRVEVYNLQKWVRKDLNLLQDLSLIFQPREFIVVVGQSGGGKSTLVDAIAGYRPATHGKVFVNDIDVYQNFDAIRNNIGFVPQKDIIHMELTVFQALDFAAQLRMPGDTSEAERHERVMEVLADLDLTHRKDVQISGLSGGQQKRVSIGVELLTRPGLFFLDEPTSGLDPGTETVFMHLMRRLADQGRTIIMVTHATKNVMLADKVVFLARGGYIAWFGPPNEALTYFDQYRSEHDRRARPMEFDQIYAILDDLSKGKGKDWAERFQAYQAYNKYIVEPLENRRKKIGPSNSLAKETKPARKGLRSAAWRQFLVLSRRNITILTRDKASLVLMLLSAPAVALLDFFIAPLVGRNTFDYVGGDAINGSVTLFILMMYTLLVGGMSQMREFVKESDIYKRERLVNLKVIPYVTSKVWVALILAFFHALAYTIIHYLAFAMPPGADVFIQVYITLSLATMTGMMLGLLASAISPNAGAAPLTLILFIIPLLVVSGALAPVPPQINQFASTRWSYQGLMGIMGIGSDISADVCWLLDKDLRDGMTLEDKQALGCRCLGINIFTPGMCNFPGVGNFYSPEIDRKPGDEPASLPARPTEPDLPPAPQPPSNFYDQVANSQYLNALSDYQNQLQELQDDFRNQMLLYEAQVGVYQTEMMKYQQDLAMYTISRVAAVKGAESVMGTITDKYGWTWVNKDDVQVYRTWLTQAWLAQIAIVLAYYLIILALIKRKDVK
ncbi:MAG: FHA domain-containing protein [Anaerolineaceae bacterium]|nr:FHA domain-containing protein [Anaerolineaceae bacterium]